MHADFADTAHQPSLTVSVFNPCYPCLLPHGATCTNATIPISACRDGDCEANVESYLPITRPSKP